MTQHDYNIANQTFPNTRTDLNNVFSAILSSNSGASAPTTTSPYMIWADTTNSLFKYRNSADSDWVSWMTTDGKHLSSDGSASTPGMAFSSDTNTGFYRVGSDSLGLSLGGSQKLAFDSSGKVGIGKSSPSSMLDIETSESTVYNSATVGGQPGNGATLRLSNTNTSANTFAQVIFASNNNRVVQRIVSGHSATTTDGFLAFVIENGGTPLEVSRITGVNMGIGTSSPAPTAILDVQSTTQGLRLPNMTTTQRDAITSPALGLLVYNTTTNKVNVYTGSWEAVTSA